jgi:NAD(P)-dependent dehydrogenase (short-subunit alcohol dehydrogenase family)
MNQFDPKVAIVSGGGSGIGKALCLELGRRGAKVVAADIDLSRAQSVADEILQTGSYARAERVDVAEEASVNELIARVVGEHRQIDYLFNNAGISVTGDFRDIPLAEWKRVVDVNLWGVVHGCSAAYPLMARQGRGHIVNMASLSGLLPFPTNIPYSTTKHAVVGFTLSLRAEAADLGVRVSLVCPGYVRTGMFEATPVMNAPKAEMLRRMPAKLMTPEEAARQILAGVERNEAMIVFPSAARWLWRLYRLTPASLIPNQLAITRRFRGLRDG